MAEIEKAKATRTEEKEKIKVAYAEIVQRRDFYEIMYYDVAEKTNYIGFGSYERKFVEEWLEECFEIVDVVEVKHSQWDDNIIGFCNVCMECGAIVERTAIKNNSGKLNYCPNCGAKMTE